VDMVSFPANNTPIWKVKITARMVVVVFIFFCCLMLMKQKYNGIKEWYTHIRSLQGYTR
jgi:hypothetical protein